MCAKRAAVSGEVAQCTLSVLRCQPHFVKKRREKYAMDWICNIL